MIVDPDIIELIMNDMALTESVLDLPVDIPSTHASVLACGRDGEQHELRQQRVHLPDAPIAPETPIARFGERDATDPARFWERDAT